MSRCTCHPAERQACGENLEEPCSICEPDQLKLVERLKRDIQTLRSACLLVLHCEDSTGATLMPESLDIVRKAIEETE